MQDKYRASDDDFQFSSNVSARCIVQSRKHTPIVQMWVMFDHCEHQDEDLSWKSCFFYHEMQMD